MKLQTSPKEFKIWCGSSKRWVPYNGYGFAIDTKGKIVGAGSGKVLTEVSKDFVSVQYTGLKDKEGKKIFEGDICKFHSLDGETVWSPKVIEWRDGRYKLGNTLIIICEMEANQIEIIGNIFEHPELLEGE